MTTCKWVTGFGNSMKRAKYCIRPATTLIVMSDGVRKFAMCAAHATDQCWPGYAKEAIKPEARE
jgi:hypothetical protein